MQKKRLRIIEAFFYLNLQSNNIKINYMYIIDRKKLAETPTYKELEAKKEGIKISFINGRSMREQITHGFMVHKNTGIIPVHIQGVNRRLILDLIAIEQLNKGGNERV